MKYTDLIGPFRNPDDPQIILWVEDGQAFGIIYPEWSLSNLFSSNSGMNSQAIKDLDDEYEDLWDGQDYSNAFNSAPILTSLLWEPLKKNYFLYGKMDSQSQKILRYKIYNYFVGSSDQPATALHNDTNEVQYVNDAIDVTEPVNPITSISSDITKKVIDAIGKPVLYTAGGFLIYYFLKKQLTKK